MKTKSFITKIFALSSICLLGNTAFAQSAADVDATFGNNGFVYSDHVSGKHEFYRGSITLTDNKTVLVGYTAGANQNVILVKHNADGTVDQNFGVNGCATFDLSLGGDEYGYAVKELFDGKLLVTGAMQTLSGNSAFIMRVEANGEIDHSFGNNGYTAFNGGANTLAAGFDLHVNQDNSIYVGASLLNNNANADFAIFKFTQGGGVDISFAAAGSNILNLGAEEIVTAMDVDATGNIYLSGTRASGGVTTGILMKLNSFGLIENSFNVSGYVEYNNNATPHHFIDVKAVAGNKVVVVGYEGTGANRKGIVKRYNADGSLDLTFSDGVQASGLASTSGVHLTRIKVLSDGKLLATGYVANANAKKVYALMLNNDGTPNIDFAPNGDKIYDLPMDIDNIDMRCLSIQSDGKFIIAGSVESDDFDHVNLMMVRIHLSDVASLSTLDQNDLVIYPNPASDVFHIQSSFHITGVECMDINGRVVQQWNDAGSAFHLNNTVPAGQYFVRIYNENNYAILKLLVK